MCVGGDLTHCTRDGVAAGMESKWGKSVANAPTLLHYNAVPLDQFLQENDGIGSDTKSALNAGLSAYITDLKRSVHWRWKVDRIGGDCINITHSGVLMESPNTTLLAAHCNGGGDTKHGGKPCSIKLECIRHADGTVD